MFSQCEILSRKIKWSVPKEWHWRWTSGLHKNLQWSIHAHCTHAWIHMYAMWTPHSLFHTHAFTLSPIPSTLTEFIFHLQLMVHMKIPTEEKLPMLKVLISSYYLLYVRSRVSCLPSSFFFLYWEKKNESLVLWSYLLYLWVTEIPFVAPEGSILQLQDCFKLQWPSIKCKNLLFGGKFHILTSNFRMFL